MDAEEQTAEPDKQQAPAEVQAVLPDADLDQIEKPQEKVDGGEETEPDEPRPSEGLGEQKGAVNEAIGVDAEQEKVGQESEHTQSEQPKEGTDGQNQAIGDNSAEQSTSQN